MKKKWNWLIVIGVLLLLFLLFNGILMLVEYNDSTSVDKQKVEVSIAEGSTINQMADELKKAGVIGSKFVFKKKVAASGYDSLQYGDYTLDKGWCLDDIIKVLATQGAKKESFNFSVPEGYSVEQICAKAVENNICTEEEFYEVLDHGKFSYDFIKEIPKDLPYRHKLQGFLFPNTYSFDSDTDAYQLIDTMLAEFDKHYQNLKGIPSDYSFYEIMTVAALVERESGLDKERPVIAGVIYNRIQDEMLLQIDATVVYACSEGMYDMKEVLFEDLEVDSLYNTYKNPGLPVGPICNPGIESIKAAILPDRHDYYFYHTDEEKKDGSHIFTETYEEHTSTMVYEEETE
ncbi:MAG: endolytic transglycosylase MltG [Ruminococcaceae bacterium]|nr:endolytic transglycosylase MltG [Oscillospiraceae bacterium]